MSKNKTLKSVLAGVLAGTLALPAAVAPPVGTFAQEFDASGVYCHDTFESGTDDWEGRGGASVSTGSTAFAGSGALSVSDRGSAWHGAMKALDDTAFKAGEEYSFSAAVSGSGNMMLSLQYKDSSGKTVYDHIANGQSSGDYVQLSNANYKLPEGSEYILYVETESGTDSFCIDEVIIAKAGADTGSSEAVKSVQGDFNGDERIDSFDLIAARKALLSSAEIGMEIADLDGDGSFAVNDIVMLSKYILAQVREFAKPKVTTTTPTTTAPVTTTTTSKAAGDYMASIRDKITVNVPSNVLKNAEGKLEHITYFSKKANREKGANVWLPPGYDSSKKYPVFYVNHGYGGDESAMVNGMGVREIATNLIKSGEAEPMIIVFTNQYTDPNHTAQTGNGQADVPGYDNFVEDMPDSLMPYIESHYPVKTGRENTAVAGFSMGGRESLYIGMKCCDKVGYIGGGAPAPGIFPTKDQFMTHPGVMSKDDMRIDPPYSPYLLMIAGGTADNMVNDFPKQYSDLFTQHGTENIYISVPGGGHDSSTVIPLMYNFIRFIFKA
ncbi:MAG: carbohydrate binding domain-containing protein [Ruminococcus sp.]|uniref:alpha/beta hydrolase-fold protein n=1 Tax=Ruminococcus sp. TaxID=41978 RepID=UPI0025E9D16F|nr:carbohydrate binding domain-containing protein [Ruminococcus sp.]MBR5683764.1 carbohydrate binding domain-containing protein [Ruminococcus sp.]